MVAPLTDSEEEEVRQMREYSRFLVIREMKFFIKKGVKKRGDDGCRYVKKEKYGQLDVTCDSIHRRKREKRQKIAF